MAGAGGRAILSSVIWVRMTDSDDALDPPPQIQLPEELQGRDGQRRALEPRGPAEPGDGRGADGIPESDKVPVDRWIPESPHDSSEYLARRNGPWPQWRPHPNHDR